MKDASYSEVNGWYQEGLCGYRFPDGCLKCELFSLRVLQELDAVAVLDVL